MTVDALIGATGFVGSNLARQHKFGAAFSSRNIHESAGLVFGTVVCAAAPGSMLLANREPERDAEALRALEAKLARITARCFVLISSVAVLQHFDGQDDEDTSAFEIALAYGRNRRELENFCAAHFERCLILRLPALFGPGLKKNFIFDLANPMPTFLTADAFRRLRSALASATAKTLSEVYAWNAKAEFYEIDRNLLMMHRGRAELETQSRAAGMTAVWFHNPDTTYQYYDVSQLWQDTQTALMNELSVLHCAVEPVRAGDVHAALVEEDMPGTGARLHHEDMQTRHARLFGQSGRYIGTAADAVSRLKAFFPSIRSTV